MEFDFGPVETLDKVPAPFQKMYVQGEDGKFGVNKEYEQIANSIIGLNVALKKERTSKKVDLTPLSSWGSSPEEIAAAINSKVSEMEASLAGNSAAKLNLDKIKEELKTAHQKDLQNHTEKAIRLQNKVTTLLVDSTVSNLSTTLKFEPELILPFVRDQVRVVEENGDYLAFVVDASGDRRYSSVTGQPMTVKELLSEMKTQPKFARLFDSEASSSQGSGGGMNPQGARQPVQGVQRALTANEKIAIGLKKQQASKGR